MTERVTGWLVFALFWVVGLVAVIAIVRFTGIDSATAFLIGFPFGMVWWTLSWWAKEAAS
jgi:hypothetical protein